MPEDDEIEKEFADLEEEDENPTNAPVVGVDIDEDDLEIELMTEEELLKEHDAYAAQRLEEEGDDVYEEDPDLLAAASGVDDEALIERIRKNLDKARWYMLQTATNRENHVKASIEHYIVKKNKRDQIFKVLIPKSTYIRSDTGGRQRTMQQKLFPSYVLLQMVMDEEYKTASELISLPNVINFVGQARKVTNARRRGKKPVNLPAPLSLADVERIMKLSATVTEEDYQPMHVKVGDAIVATSGPMQGFSGVVTGISEDRKTITATMTIFGRENSVDLEAHEVEKDANAAPPADVSHAAAGDPWDGPGADQLQF
eukprot:tig00020878_g14870.t1